MSGISAYPWEDGSQGGHWLVGHPLSPCFILNLCIFCTQDKIWVERFMGGSVSLSLHQGSCLATRSSLQGSISPMWFTTKNTSLPPSNPPPAHCSFGASTIPIGIQRETTNVDPWGSQKLNQHLYLPLHMLQTCCFVFMWVPNIWCEERRAGIQKAISWLHLEYVLLAGCLVWPRWERKHLAL